tara:strand:+ start:7733 stop:7960 length:228 start_codon:yes stop_codon:yes gene_type:complete
MEYYGVKGHVDLLRNSETGAIVNTNDLDYEKYVSRRDAKKAQVQQSQTMEQDLATLKNEMNEIKSLLKELVSNVN